MGGDPQRDTAHVEGAMDQWRARRLVDDRGKCWGPITRLLASALVAETVVLAGGALSARAGCFAAERRDAFHEGAS